MFGFNKDEPTISFVSTVPGLTEVEEILPAPSNKYIPSWWKKMPRSGFNSNLNKEVFTAKACPSFVDYFSQGYILPAWSDMEVTFDPKTQQWSYINAVPNESTDFGWSAHSGYQFLDYVDASFYGQDPKVVLKALPPWRIITKPGWSVLQQPLFYHFDNPLVAMPGVIDTDISHEINIQMFYFGEGETIKIKRGDPLVQYIPFKRKNDISFEVRYKTESDQNKLYIQNANLKTALTGSSAYRKLQSQKRKEI